MKAEKKMENPHLGEELLAANVLVKKTRPEGGKACHQNSQRKEVSG